MIDANEANGLFREYRRTGDKNIRNRLVENYIYIAEIHAKSLPAGGWSTTTCFRSRRRRL